MQSISTASGDPKYGLTDSAPPILFTPLQQERLLEAKAWWQEGDQSLDYLAERARQEATLKQIRAFLAAFRDADPEDENALSLLEPLLQLVRSLSANRALNRTLKTHAFSIALRELLFGDLSLPVRLTHFLRQRVGVQTTSQLLYAAFPDAFPLVSGATRAAIAPERAQVTATRKQIAADYPTPLLPRIVLNLLTDFALYSAARNFLGLENFVDLNAVLWHAREISVPIVYSEAREPTRILRETTSPYGTTLAESTSSDKPILGSLVDNVSPSHLTESILLTQIEDFIAGQGFTFPPLAIRDYYISLKTKPFVILSGLSGTGKTRLTELLAEALTGQVEKQYLLIPVHPDWNDSTALLGYYNIVTDRYVSTPFLEFLLQANRPEMHDRAFFICLDEMNLARVEYYFADLLSAMETRTRTILLQSGHSIRLPLNLFFTGSINTDEATHPFSKKVLDRANTIEFMQVEFKRGERFANLPMVGNPLERQHLFLRSRITDTIEAEERLAALNSTFPERILGVLTVLNGRLETRALQFGYRIRDEILRYIANSFDANGTGLFAGESEANLNIALDLQIVQKILPRISGTQEQLAQLLAYLVEWAVENLFIRTHAKLVQMRDRALEDGIVTFYQQ